MKIRVIGLCLLAATVFLGGAAKASAQEPATLGVMYDVLYHTENYNSAAGLHVDIAKNVGMIDVVGEVGFNHFDGFTYTGFLGGGRYGIPAAPNAKYAPFVQLLLGGVRCGACEDTNFGLQPGVGVDFSTSQRFKIRGQFDYRRIFGEFEDANDFRLSGGIVLTLGR